MTIANKTQKNWRESHNNNNNSDSNNNNNDNDNDNNDDNDRRLFIKSSRYKANCEVTLHYWYRVSNRRS